MTADEFRSLRVAAGLSVREAATALGVAANTVQRWQMGQYAIPEDAQARIAQLAGDASPGLATARVLGRLYAVLELARGKTIPHSLRVLLRGKPAAAFGELLRLVRDEAPERYARAENEVEDLMNDISAFPPFLTPAQEAEMLLAYYKRRAARRQHAEDDHAAQPSLPAHLTDQGGQPLGNVGVPAPHPGDMMGQPRWQVHPGATTKRDPEA